MTMQETIFVAAMLALLAVTGAEPGKTEGVRHYQAGPVDIVLAGW
jgi:hypothetical protein